jgi:hypothetical protein
VWVPCPCVVAPDAHGDAFKGAEPGALDVIADADPDIAAGLARSRLARAEAVVIRERQSASLAQREIAARIDERLAVAEYEADVVRHLRGRDHVAATQLGAVDAERAGDPVHQALHGEHRLRASGAADHRGRHPVGEHHRGLELERRHHIGAGERGRGDIGRDDPPRQIGAVVMDHGAAQAENLALAIDRDGDLPVLVALLRRREEMLATVLDPFHRPAELRGRDRDNDLLRIERRLGAEAAADERRDDAHFVGTALEEVGDGRPADVRRLRRRPHGQHARCRLLVCQHGAAFQRHRGAAVLEDVFLEHVRRGRKRVLDIAIGHRHERGDVAGKIAVRGRCAGRERIAAITHHRQHLVVDHHRRGGILGEIAVVGDDHRDCLADIADFVAGERILGAQRRDGGVGHRHRQRFGREPTGHVGDGEHRMDAGQGECRARIDCVDARMGNGAAHERRVQQAGQFDVVDEARASGEQGRVFDPRHAGAELPRTHTYVAPCMPAKGAEGAEMFIAASGSAWRPRVGRYRRARQAARPARNGQPSRPCVRARALDPATAETNTARDKADAGTPPITITATGRFDPWLISCGHTRTSSLFQHAERGGGLASLSLRDSLLALRLEATPSHPDRWRDPTSPRTRGEVPGAARSDWHSPQG